MTTGAGSGITVEQLVCVDRICCTGCQGTGISGDPETNGWCWDCRGTGHAHLQGQQ